VARDVCSSKKEGGGVQREKRFKATQDKITPGRRFFTSEGVESAESFARRVYIEGKPQREKGN